MVLGAGQRIKLWKKEEDQGQWWGQEQMTSMCESELKHQKHKCLKGLCP